jgi:hypothetical protein
MYTALRDVQLALSTEYTLPESPKPLTLKCYFRHARILYTLARYTEALAQIEQYRQLSADGDYGSESKILALDDLISKAVSATEGSNVRLKVELVRAVNVSTTEVSDPSKDHSTLLVSWNCRDE